MTAIQTSESCKYKKQHDDSVLLLICLIFMVLQIQWEYKQEDFKF